MRPPEPQGESHALPWSIRTLQAVHGPALQVGRCDGGWCVRLPAQPTFFWGNFLHFDAPPDAAAARRWPLLFDERVRAGQPEVQHLALAWSGDDAGTGAAFAAIGCTTLRDVVMAAARVAPAALPSVPAIVRPLSSPSDWRALFDARMADRDDAHAVDAWRAYLTRKVAGWRAGADEGRGTWLGAFVDGQLAASLGVYVETAPGPDGLRLARFQDVLTATAWRRRGLCQALLAAAADTMAGRADRFVIVADADDTPQHLYARAGFAVIGHQRGVQRIGYPAAASIA